LVHYLKHTANVDIVLDVNVASLLDDHAFRVAPIQKLAGKCDLVIVVGGDGSLLQVASILAEHDLPVIGIIGGAWDS